jgi:cell cycle checkpoint protein
VLTKDNPFTIFHALGKFLYNKRINPSTKKVEQLPYDMMKRAKKPELYFRHKDILNQTQLDKPSFGLYLHENMLDFFTDITEIADCLDVYSVTDFAENMVTYSYD